MKFIGGYLGTERAKFVGINKKDITKDMKKLLE